jgi:hypothetical protein
MEKLTESREARDVAEQRVMRVSSFLHEKFDAMHEVI